MGWVAHRGAVRAADMGTIIDPEAIVARIAELEARCSPPGDAAAEMDVTLETENKRLRAILKEWSICPLCPPRTTHDAGIDCMEMSDGTGKRVAGEPPEGAEHALAATQDATRIQADELRDLRSQLAAAKSLADSWCDAHQAATEEAARLARKILLHEDVSGCVLLDKAERDDLRGRFDG